MLASWRGVLVRHTQTFWRAAIHAVIAYNTFTKINLPSSFSAIDLDSMSWTFARAHRAQNTFSRVNFNVPFASFVKSRGLERVHSARAFFK